MNFGELIEVQMRFVSLEERNFTQLSLPELFKNEDHQAPNENLTNMMGYLITRIKIQGNGKTTNMMKNILRSDDLNTSHTMVKHLVNKMGGEIFILNNSG